MGGEIEEKKNKSSSADTTQAHVCKRKLLHSKLEYEAVWHWISHVDQLRYGGVLVLSSSLSVYSNCSPWTVSLLWSQTLCAPGEWCWFVAPWCSAVSALSLGETKPSFKISWVCLVHANGALAGNGCWVAGMLYLNAALMFLCRDLFFS